MAIEGFGAKHEDLVKNPRFSLMPRLNPRFVFKPDKFVGFRCSGYAYMGWFGGVAESAVACDFHCASFLHRSPQRIHCGLGPSRTSQPP